MIRVVVMCLISIIVQNVSSSLLVKVLLSVTIIWGHPGVAIVGVLNEYLNVALDVTIDIG